MALKEQSPWAVLTKPDNVTNLETTVQCARRNPWSSRERGVNYGTESARCELVITGHGRRCLRELKMLSVTP